MQSSIAAVRGSQESDRRLLESALYTWRDTVLAWLEAEAEEARTEIVDAEDGLRIVGTNPGLVSDDVIMTLWDRITDGVTKRDRIERVHEGIMNMNLAHLMVLFQRATKIKTYPWDLQCWNLPSIF